MEKIELTKEQREKAGKVNYDAYKESVGGVSFNGQKLKEFHEMPEKICNAWMEGAIQAYEHIATFLNDDKCAILKK